MTGKSGNCLVAESGCVPRVCQPLGGRGEGTGGGSGRRPSPCLLSSMTSLLKSPDSDLFSILGQDSLIRLNFFYSLFSPGSFSLFFRSAFSFGKTASSQLDLCKLSSFSSIFLCHHFRSFTPYSGIASQISSHFRQYDNLQYQICYSLQQTFQFGSYDLGFCGLAQICLF